MSEWAGLVFLLGAGAGYAAFMVFQPYRPVLAEAYRTMRDYPCLWLVAGSFESVRLTVRVIAQIAGGEMAPEAFLRTEQPGPVPYVSDLFLQALEATAGAMLSMATTVVVAWPVSVGLAIALLCNGGNGLRDLWGRFGSGRLPVRRAFAILAAGFAVVHLVGAGRRWFGEGGTGPEMLAAGGSLFEMGCAVAVQAWLVLWFLGARRGDFRGVPLSLVLERTAALLPLIMVYWVAREGWSAREFEGRIADIVVPAAAFAAFWALPAVIRTIGGTVGLVRSFARHGLWVARRLERVFWWLAAAGMHLVLLILCGRGMEAAFEGMPWLLWGWGMFYAFLKAGVIVWLLGAFVLLVEESEEAITAPRKARKKRRK